MDNIENRLSILEKKLGLSENDILDTELRLEALEKKLLADENGDVSVIVSQDSEGNKVKYDIVDATAVNRLKSYVDNNLRPEIFAPINEAIEKSNNLIDELIQEIYDNNTIESESRIDHIEKVLRNIITTLDREASIRIETQYLANIAGSDSGSSDSSGSSSGGTVDSKVLERLDSIEARVIVLEESTAIIKINKKIEDLKAQVEEIDLSKINNKIETETYLLEQEILNLYTAQSELSNDVYILRDEVKNYKTELSETLNSEINNINNNINNYKSEVNNTIETEFSNINYTLEETKKETDNKINAVSDKIISSNQETDNKINNLNDDLNNKINNLNNDLSSKITETEISLEVIDSSLKEKIDSEVNDINEIIDYTFDILKDRINLEADSLNRRIGEEVYGKIGSLEEKVDTDISSLGEENKKLNDKIETLEAYILILEERLSKLENSQPEGSSSSI